MSAPPPEPPLPLRLRLLVGGLSLLLGLVGAELLVRLADRGALPHLALFEAGPGDAIRLQPSASMRLRQAAGGRFVVATDGLGLRVPQASAETPPPGRWLVVGDSQVLGMGVEAEESFPSQLGALNAGVPGHGVIDAIHQARRLAPVLDPAGVVVVVNQANDWEEGTRPVGQRYEVIGGRLLREGASGLGAAFWASPLSRLHLLYYLALLARLGEEEPAGAPPAWLSQPAGQRSTTAALATAIADLAHGPLPVVVAFLPVDVAVSPDRVPVSPFGRYTAGLPVPPWEDTTLRDQLHQSLQTRLPQDRLVDLLPALDGAPEAFLPEDYHLSAEGHRRVADALRPALSPETP